MRKQKEDATDSIMWTEDCALLCRLTNQQSLATLSPWHSTVQTSGLYHKRELFRNIEKAFEMVLVHI